MREECGRFDRERQIDRDLDGRRVGLTAGDTYAGGVLGFRHGGARRSVDAREGMRWVPATPTV
ncbi:hypothetical protein Rwratislav_30974 [Rhodococcus wratislaviensis IFP 2016]|nr:hypothetical protein Pd630_LPD14032 [Rhodococcus opacus PD630]ELB89150.1 hypothetical protein Rwratislav_30974 [Rhodococcus wratislaviensis IFP 2016]